MQPLEMELYLGTVFYKYMYCMCLNEFEVPVILHISDTVIAVCVKRKKEKTLGLAADYLLFCDKLYTLRNLQRLSCLIQVILFIFGDFGIKAWSNTSKQLIPYYPNLFENPANCSV